MTSRTGKIRGLFWEILQAKGVSSGKQTKKSDIEFPLPYHIYIWCHLGFRIRSAETYYHASGQPNCETKERSSVCFDQGLLET